MTSKKPKRFVVLTEFTDRDQKIRINVVKYGLEKQEVISQQPSRKAAEDYCKKRGLTIVGEQPELFTATDGAGNYKAKDKDGNDLSLTPFQRRILNRRAASATLRKNGLLD